MARGRVMDWKTIVALADGGDQPREPDYILGNGKPFYRPPQNVESPEVDPDAENDSE